MIFYMTVDTCIHCQHCINRMFNTGRKIEIGIGNITSDIVILLPMYGGNKFRNKILEDLKAIWFEYTGYNILEQCYLTYNIKCSAYSSYNIYKNSIENCRNILNEELYNIHYNYMITINTYNTIFPNGCTNKIINYGNYTFYNIKFPFNKYDDKDVKLAIKTDFVNAIKYYRYMKNNLYDKLPML